MSAGYSLTYVSETYASIYISADPAYPYYRVFCRPKSQSETIYDNYHNITSGGDTVYFYNLTPDTVYVVNVYAYKTIGGEYIVLGASEFRTNPVLAEYTTTLTFSANGGSGAPGQITATDDSLTKYMTIPPTVPVRSGYTFLGWAMDSAATAAEYLPGASYPFSVGEYTLYAVWKEGTGDGCAYIYYDGAWHSATAYIYYGGAWHEAVPHIYYGGWKQAGK